LRWQKAEWDIVGTPWVLNSGMMLRLRNGKHAAASICGWRQTAWMPEWRDLRRLVLKPAQE
jgi:toxin CptA